MVLYFMRPSLSVLAPGNPNPPFFFPGIPNPPGVRPVNPRPFNERNEALGGYLEGRLNGHVPVTNWMDFNPYGIISVSFRDWILTRRVVALRRSSVNWVESCTGWGQSYRFTWLIWAVFRALHGAPPDGTEIFNLSERTPTTLQNPPPGTDRSEWWGAARNSRLRFKSR